MIRFKTINIIALIFLLISCSATLSTKKEIHNNIEMLYGKTSIQQLYFDYPEWKNVELQYQPNTLVLEKLRKTDTEYQVQIFFATWCSDSKNEVPKFFKVIKTANMADKIKIDLWAVDRKKHLANKLPRKKNIDFVPTFIIYKNDREIGRIIETPDFSIEQDLLEILTGEFNDAK